MKKSTINIIKKVGFNPDDFTTESPQSLIGRVVMVDPKYYGNEQSNLLWEVTGGFGAELGARGSAIFATRLADNVKSRIDRYDLIAVRKV